MLFSLFFKNKESKSINNILDKKVKINSQNVELNIKCFKKINSQNKKDNHLAKH
jgi:hypothetical protein